MRVVRVTESAETGPVTRRGAADREPDAAPAPDPAQALTLVLVRWHDAWFDSDQQAAEEWRADYIVQTIGFLVRREPHLISVAQELLPDGDGFRAVTHIPTSTIESITALQRTAAPARIASGGAAHENLDGAYHLPEPTPPHRDGTRDVR